MARPLRIHIIQNSPDTPAGSVLEWLKPKGHAVTIVEAYKGDALPTVSDTDWLIILGGSMNVDEIEAHPWLTGVKSLLKSAIEHKTTCLGLCLGGQLLAQSLGAKVKKHDHWEVGWHGISLGSDHVEGISRLMVFQWHQDTFELPANATRVATNKITENQAFMYGENVIGLQFHPEATEEWIRECGEEVNYPIGPHVQPKEQLLEGLVFIHPMRKWFFSLLERMESTASSHSAKALKN